MFLKDQASFPSNGPQEAGVSSEHGEADLGMCQSNNFSDVSKAWFENSAEPVTTRPIHLPLEPHCAEWDIRYDTH